MAKDTTNTEEHFTDFHHHHQRGVVFPIFLITIGILLLLNNAGIVPWSIWQEIWQFWPVLLILLGLQIILGRSWISRFVIGTLALLIGIFIILYSLYRVNVFHNSTLDMYFSKIPQFNQQIELPQ